MIAPIQWIQDKIQKRGRPAPDDDSYYPSHYFSALSAAGITVTPELAAKCSVVYACARILSRDISTLPLNLYQTLPDGSRDKVRGHIAHRLLHTAPNPEATSEEFRRAMEWQMCLRGNAYAYIDRDSYAELRGLYLITPDAVTPQRNGAGVLEYKITTSAGPEIYPAKDILHFRDITVDGITGLSPIQQNADSIALAMVAEKHGASFLKNNASLGGVLTTPNKLDTDERENFTKSWNAQVGGVNNAGKMRILEQGFDYKPIAVSAKDAQLLETRLFQVQEIAGRIYGVPLQKLGEHTHSTYSNAEQFGLEYITDTIRPICVRREQRLNMSLLTDKERADGFYFEHAIEGLLRGDLKAQAEWFKTHFYIGTYSQNDIRQKLNEKKIENGDSYFVPENMRPCEAPYARGSNVKSEGKDGEQEEI